MDPRPVVLFDGVCNLCNRSVQFILKKDKKKQFRFASLQGKTGQAILQRFDLPMDHFNTILLLDGEKLYTHSTGTLKIAKRLSGAWKLLYGFIIIPRFIRDLVYNLVARNRYKWFGKKDSCMIPLPEWKERFLD